MICVLGGLRVKASAESVADYRSDQRLIRMAADVASLAHALEGERDLTAIRLVRRKQEHTEGLTRLRRDVDGALGRITVLADASPAGFVQLPALAGNTVGNSLQILRSSVDETGNPFPVSAALRAYGDIISSVIGGLDDLDEAVHDPTLAQRMRSSAALSFAEDAVSLQRALVAVALERGTLDPKEQSELEKATSDRRSALDYFFVLADPATRRAFEETVTGRDVDESERIRVLLTNRLVGLTRSADKEPVADPAAWYAAASRTGDLIRQVRNGIEKNLSTTAEDRLRDVLSTVFLDSALLVLLLLITAAVTTAVARSITRPLQSLRSTALNVAAIRLPTVVKILEQSEGPPRAVCLRPVSLPGTDEIAEVGRAFHAVHTEAVRLAAEQAQLRANTNAMLVNLARRNQDLIQRQLQLIEGLESTEQDPDQLENLFRLDHLATRMRRHGENLLVLAGTDGSSDQHRPPAPLLDVVRAALSEVEGYERVTVGALPDLYLASAALDNTVHLLAELIENALRLSDSHSRVTIGCCVVEHGVAVVEVLDNGPGIPPHLLEDINTRLAAPSPPDVQASRQMGLFVVAHLAARHQMKVRLRPGSPRGTVAELRIPQELLLHFTEPPGQRTAPAPEQHLLTGSETNAFQPSPPSAAADTEDAGAVCAAQGSPPPLPVRTPGSLLRPGALPGGGVPETRRRAASLRSRLTSYQQGLRRGRERSRRATTAREGSSSAEE
ncbi:nitrate- and nitrite sensing domain-containing protein [Streptomyces sp. R11]|uniref:histidine kinase n=1 Tax=Streptomyces sp. R11 TaxID=3238625 RepID=A0AB39NE03_9ACTN